MLTACNHVFAAEPACRLSHLLAGVSEDGKMMVMMMMVQRPCIAVNSQMSGVCCLSLPVLGVQMRSAAWASER